MVNLKSEEELQQNADEFKMLARRGDREAFSMAMKQCLGAVIRYQRRQEGEYVSRVIKPGIKRSINYGEEMNQLLGMTSEWLADVVVKEYKFVTCVEAFNNCTIDDEVLFVTLRRGGQAHQVDKFD
ncbi:hypothetical protein ON010_g17730 [Phytophthora cinnamomi]|nr:hypothetical protein ON010_g17730 [Phytophthora cinnamomi]